MATVTSVRTVALREAPLAFCLTASPARLTRPESAPASWTGQVTLSAALMRGGEAVAVTQAPALPELWLELAGPGSVMSRHTGWTGGPVTVTLGAAHSWLHAELRLGGQRVASVSVPVEQTGEDAVLWGIESDYDSIVRSEDGTMTPSKLRLYKRKTTGGSVARTTEGRLTYTLGSGLTETENVLSGEGGETAAIPPATKVVTARLYGEGNMVLATRTIPVIAEGEQGPAGADALSVSLSPSVVSVPRNGTVTKVRVYVEVTRGEEAVTGFGFVPQGTAGVAAGLVRSTFSEPDGRRGWELTYGGTEEVDVRIPVTVTVGTKSYGRTIQVVSYEVPTGPAGAVCRYTEWAAGTLYNDGSVEEASGIRYIDIIHTPADRYFVCIQPHTSTAGPVATGNATGCPSETNGYWQRMNSQAPIYTPLILADNARIDFLTGQEIVFGEGPYIWGRLGAPTGGGQYVMWMGGATAQDATYAMDYCGRTWWGTPATGRVGLDPTTGQLRIYGPGETVATTVLDGRAHDGPQGVRAGDVLTVPVRETLAGEDLWRRTTSGTLEQTVELGYFQLTQASHVRVGADVGLYVGRATVADMVTASVQLVLQRGTTVRNGNTATESLTLSSSIAENQGGDRAESRSGHHSLLYDSLEAGTGKLLAGPWVVKLKVTLTLGKVSGGSGTVTGALAQARLYPGFTAGVVEESETYRARYYGNGLFLGQGVGDYVCAWRDGEGGMAFEAVNRAGHGIGVGPDGVRVMAGGGWMGLDAYIGQRVKEILKKE